MNGYECFFCFALFPFQNLSFGGLFLFSLCSGGVHLLRTHYEPIWYFLDPKAFLCIVCLEITSVGASAFFSGKILSTSEMFIYWKNAFSENTSVGASVFFLFLSRVKSTNYPK